MKKTFKINKFDYFDETGNIEEAVNFIESFYDSDKYINGEGRFKNKHTITVIIT